MKRFLIIAGMCIAAQSSFAGEGDRPEPRPTLCRIEGSQQLRPCTVIWNVAYRANEPVLRPTPVKARKIIRLPWTIGAFQ